MNILTAVILRLGKKQRVTLLFENAYSDQDLKEFNFHDGAMVSVYKNDINETCTCKEWGTKQTCRHVAKVQRILYKRARKRQKGQEVYVKTVFKTYTYSKESGDCLICLESFGLDSKIVQCVNCKKEVHKACLKEWLSTSDVGDQNTCIHCQLEWGGPIVDTCGSLVV
jgi:hypothetical protein